MIFGINNKSDISKLLYVISRGEWNLRQFWNITSGIYAKYDVQIMLLFVYTTTHKRFVIFTCRYFKLSWNTTVLSQSNCRNFWCSSISIRIPCQICNLFYLPLSIGHFPVPKTPTSKRGKVQTFLVKMIFAWDIVLLEKFLQFDWLRAVVFQLNLKYLHVKITNLVWVVV